MDEYDEEKPLTIEEALLELAILGYDDVTEEANAHNGTDNLSMYAFAHPQGGVIYCHSEGDVFDIL